MFASLIRLIKSLDEILEASDESAGLPHRASPVSSVGSQGRLALAGSAVVERCNSASPPLPHSASGTGGVFVEKRLLSKGRCTHNFVQPSH